VLNAALGYVKPQSTISNFDRLNEYIMGMVQHCGKMAMVESIRGRPGDQVLPRYLRKYVFQHILKFLKLTLIQQQMVAIFVTLTPGGRNEFINFHTATVLIAVLVTGVLNPNNQYNIY
jgi:hypothetical protein